MPPNPAIIPNRHGPPILDILTPTLHLDFVRGGEDGDIGAEHAPVANGHETAVEDGKVEVGVEAVAEGDVAAVVDVEGGFDEDVWRLVGEIVDTVRRGG